MQATLETTTGLERKMTVVVPADKIEKQVAQRLIEISKTANLKGFRPGHVPTRVIKQRYGSSIRIEVIEQEMRESLSQAINEQQLKVAGMPEIEPKEIGEGKDFSYVATFEVYPEIDVTVEGLIAEKPVAKVADSDVNDTVEKLRKERATWQDKTGAAADEDKVTIDFVGRIDGEIFAGGSASDVELELGSGRMIPGFEEGLVGAKAGDEVDLKVTFPEDYHNKQYAGKAAVFATKIKKVEHAVLPEVNEEFAKSFGITDGSVDKLKADIRKNLELDLQRLLKGKLQEQFSKQLLEKNQFSVPKALIEQEIKHMAKTIGFTTELPEQLKDTMREQAERRIALGLLYSELVRKLAIEINAEKVREKIEEVAQSYEDPEEVVAWYYSDDKRLSEIQAVALEDEIITKLEALAEITEKAVAYSELSNKAK